MEGVCTRHTMCFMYLMEAFQQSFSRDASVDGHFKYLKGGKTFASISVPPTTQLFTCSLASTPG